MSEGVLNFSLGIETAGFSEALKEGGAHLWEFLSIAETGRAIMEKFQSAFERGSRLFNAGFASGMSVKSLYQLQEGFKEVGLSGDEVQSMTFRLQHALSGVNETGEKTAGAFALLHLNMADLQKMDPASQFLAVVDAMSKLDSGTQTGVGAAIFGRYGASGFLQLARQAETFKDAINGASKGGDVFAEMASHMSKVLRTLERIESHIEIGWAKASRGFIEPLERLLDKFDKEDWEKMGGKIAYAINLGFGIITNGKLGAALGESFKFAVDLLGVYAVPVFENFGYLLLKAFETPLVYLQSRMEYIADGFLRGDVSFLKYANPAAYVLSKLGPQPNNKDRESFETIYERNKKEGVKFNYGTGEYGTSDIKEDANARLRAANAAAAIRAGQYKKALEALVPPGHAILESLKPIGKQPGDEKKKDDKDVMWQKPNVTQWEKIGLVMAHGGQAIEYARQTANHTRESAAHLRKIAANTSMTSRQPRHNSP